MSNAERMDGMSGKSPYQPDGLSHETRVLYQHYDTFNTKVWMKRALEAEAALTQANLELENREAAVCPEDVGFEEYIASLKATLTLTRKWLRNHAAHTYECDPWNCSCGLTELLGNDDAESDSIANSPYKGEGN